MTTKTLTDLLHKLRANDHDVLYHGQHTCTLDGNDVTDDIVAEVATLLRKNTSIRFLVLTVYSKNEFTQQRLRVILESLVCHPSVKRIFFNSNGCSVPVAVDMLTSRLRGEENQLQLTHLDMSFMRTLSIEHAIVLFNNLQMNRFMVYLNLDQCFVCYRSLQQEQLLGQAIRRFLETNTTLQSLYLEGNDLGYRISEEIGIGLRCNKSLNELHYQCNNIQNYGCIALAKSLRINTHLSRLNLSQNTIGDDGILALAQVLTYKSSLRILSLSYNVFTTCGIQSLAVALRYNTSLERIFLTCTIPDQIELINSLQYNSTLDWIGFYNNLHPSSEEMETLQTAIQYVLDYNDTVTNIRHEINRIESTVTRPLFIQNERRERIAPKKGSRQRSDIFVWIISIWSDPLAIIGI